VHGGNAERMVDPKWLGIFNRAPANGRVAGVGDAHGAFQPGDVVFIKNIAYQSVAFFLVEMTVIGQDAGRILAAVLQGEQTVVEFADNRFV